jgi:formylglycine-generating enzyme required for sulfatase activity
MRRPSLTPRGVVRAIATGVTIAVLMVWGSLAGTVAAAAAAETRHALVIGNDRYVHLGAERQLRNAVADARLMRDTLTALGFAVIHGENLDRRAMIDRLADLAGRLGRDDTAFVYFAGHGVSLAGANYLLPSDIPEPRAAGRGEEGRLAEHAIAEASVIERLSTAGARVAVLVLDACRDNPLQGSDRRAVGGVRGLAQSAPAQGIFAVYAAGFGQSALDRLGPDDRHPNSVFTRVFAETLRTPGLDLKAVATLTRRRVVEMTRAVGYDQFPAYYDQLVGADVLLAGPAATDSKRDAGEPGRIAAAAPPGPPAAPAAPPEASPVPAVGIAPAPRRLSGPLDAAQERALRPGDRFTDCPTCPDMTVVPAGAFTMGSPEAEPQRTANEGPQQVVTVAKAFAVGTFEVTVDQFAAFVAATGRDTGTSCYTLEQGSVEERPGRSWRSPGFPQTGAHPATCIGWHDAAAFTAWLAETTGRPYRLPSEAEWEYALRGVTTAGPAPRYHFGDDPAAMCGYGNAADLSLRSALAGRGPTLFVPCRDDHVFTAPVGSFSPNGFGLHDMHGNVAEWTADCWRDGHAGAPGNGDARKDGDCGRRVLRGGSWVDDGRRLRAAARTMMRADDRSAIVGVRVVRDLVR